MDQLTDYIRLFHPVTPGEAEVIVSHFEPGSFKEGEFLFRGENSICKELFFVGKGILRIASIKDNGAELTHYFYRENQFCTILQSFNDETATDAGILAACNAEVLTISHARLHSLYQEIPYMKGVIDQLNQLRLIEKVNVRNVYLGEDAETQYKLFVMQNPDIALRVAQKHIASYLGITPQSLSRIRKNIR